MVWYVWLLVFLVCLGIEIITTSIFFFLCFSFGALFAMTASLLGAGNIITVTIFCVASLFSLLLIRPLIKCYIKKKKVESNIDALIGAPAIVLSEIKAGLTGQIKVAGEIWLATSDEDIAFNEKVEILSVDGTKLIVKKYIK